MDITFAYTRQGQWQMRHYIRQQMRMYIRCIAAFAMLLTMMTDVIAKSTEVEWEIVGRYRLIKDSESEARLFDLATLAPDLQCAVDSRDKCTKDKYLSVIEAYSKKAPKGNIGFKKMPDTFYNSISGKYDEEYVKDPKHWKIIFGINVDKPNTKKCNWYLDDIAVLGSGDCNKFQFNIPISAGQTVRVETNDGLTGTVTVNPKDILVVGMGDSYASGEGMPDVPAVTGIAPAQWLDEKCHRSLLSAQSLAAARLAAENPHQSVTFITRACSGARISDVIDVPEPNKDIEAELHKIKEERDAHLPPEDAREMQILINSKREGRIANIGYKNDLNPDDLNSDLKILPAQLHAVNDDLKVDTKNKTSPKRQPDLVFLSVSGNDYGFVDAIQNMLLTDIVKSEVNGRSSIDLAEKYKKVASNTRKVAWYGLSQLALQLTDTDKGFPNAVIVQTGYPNPLMRDGAKGQFCFADTDMLNAEYFQISEQDGFLGNLIDSIINRLRLKGSQNEYIALHNDFIRPLTGTVADLSWIEKNKEHDYSFREASIGISCALATNDRNALTSSKKLHAKFVSDGCNRFRDGKHGFTSFDIKDVPNINWRFALARNETGKESKKAHTQIEGFVTNGFCHGNSFNGVKGRWFNVLGDALTNLSSTGDIIKGIADGGYAGIAHPNIYGQLFLAERTWVAIPNKFKTNN